MKIANIFNDGRVGGPQRRIVQIANKLTPKGIETIMYFPYMGDELIDYISEFQINYVNVKLTRIRLQNPIFNGLKYIINMPIEVLQLVRSFKKHNIDVVHINGIFTIQPIFAAKFAGIPSVWHLNDVTLSPRIYGTIRIMFSWLVDIKVYSAKRVVKHYLDVESSKTEILYPPVDVQKFSHPVNQNVLLDEYPVFNKDIDEIRLLAIGNINPAKGFIYLIKAVGKVKKVNKNWKLYIVGGALETNAKYYNDLLTEIKNLDLNDRVVFTGTCKHIPEVLATSDVFIMSSIAESGPMVLIEALAAGKTVIATNVGFVDEVIINEENGLVVPASDIDLLSDAIVKVLENDEVRNKYSSRAEKSINKEFTLHSVSEKTCSVYKKLVSR